MTPSTNISYVLSNVPIVGITESVTRLSESIAIINNYFKANCKPVENIETIETEKCDLARELIEIGRNYVSVTEKTLEQKTKLFDSVQKAASLGIRKKNHEINDRDALKEMTKLFEEVTAVSKNLKQLLQKEQNLRKPLKNLRLLAEELFKGSKYR